MKTIHGSVLAGFLIFHLSWSVALYAQPTGPGFALHYDGTSQYVNANSVQVTNSGDFTVECWAQADALILANRTLFAQGDGSVSGGTTAFYIGVDGSSHMRLGRSWDPTGIAYPPNTNWHHLAVVKVSSNAWFYLDGALAGTHLGPIVNPTNTSVMRFGRDAGTINEFWKGQIDEVRIWSLARSAAEIAANMNRPLLGTEPGLSCYWRFDEGAGVTIHDVSGTSASLQSGPLWTASTVPFVPGILTSNLVGLGTSNAFLRGSVYPNGNLTTAWFEYGAFTNYGSLSASSLALTPANVGIAISNLNPGATYHFRLDGSNSVGLNFGADQTFRTLSTNADLFDLTCSGGALSPAFSPGTTSYTLSNGVPYTVTNVSVTAWVADIAASVQVRVNGGSYQAVSSGTPSSLLALNVGDNPIDVRVTASDGVTSKTNTLTITRLPPPPTVTTSPADQVGATTARLNGSVNPNGDVAEAHFEWGQTTSYSNVTPSFFPGGGTNTLGIMATVSNLMPATVYYFRLTATNTGGLTVGADVSFTTLSTNADLTDLSLSVGSLTPGFSSVVTGYTAYVAAGISNIMVTPTAADASATIQVWVNGAPTNLVSSGVSSGPLVLDFGANTIEVLVTAQDPAFSKTYTLEVSRVRAPLLLNSYLSSLTQSNATFRVLVFPNGAPTTAWFDWGETTSYGHLTMVTNVGSGTGSNWITVFGAADSLTPLVTYHFRPVATNISGWRFGVDQSFNLPLYNLGECGPNGRIFWIDHAANTSTQARTMALDEGRTNLYWSLGTKLMAVDSSAGTNLWQRDFGTVSLGRPVVADGLSQLLVVAGSDGYLYSVERTSGVTRWLRSLKRATCSSDSITATPVIQLLSRSDTNFAGAVGTDLVIAGTYDQCGTTTANRLYAIDSATGNPKWVFNVTGTYEVGGIAGVVVDYSRNLALFTADAPVLQPQDTICAISTTDGTRRWGLNLGAVSTGPVLANGNLYVINTAGTLYKISPADGSIVWSTQVASGGSTVTLDLSVDPLSNIIFVTDSGGNLHALHDGGNSVGALWASNLSGATVVSTAAADLLSGVVYAGAGDGTVAQIKELDGNTELLSPLFTPGSGTARELLVVSECGSRRLYVVQADEGNLSRVCIPWIGLPGTDVAGIPFSIQGTVSPSNSQLGQALTCSLTINNPAQSDCLSVLGVLPPGLSLGLVSASQGSVSLLASNEFLVQFGSDPNYIATINFTATSTLPGPFISSFSLNVPGLVTNNVVVTNYVFLPTLAVALNGGLADVTWTKNAVEFHLECSPTLSPTANWQTISSGITTISGLNHYLVNDTALTTNRFYRLKSP